MTDNTSNKTAAEP